MRQPSPRARSEGRRAGSHVWLDGKLVHSSRARISIFDRGFLYGDGVFDTLRAYQGVLVFWDRHARRLRSSLRRFRIPEPGVDLARAARALLDACRLSDATLRVTVTRGTGRGLGPRPEMLNASPTVLLTARSIDPRWMERHRAGVTAIRLSFGNGMAGATSGHKTLDYLNAVLGSIVAQDRGADEALFIDSDGTASEATTSNLFVASRGRLKTPPLESGCLPGVTRGVVIELARRAGIDLDQSPIGSRELDSAEEIFLTNTTVEVLPVVRLDGSRIGRGNPGPITRLLQERYRAAVSRAVARRIRKRD